MSDTLHRLHLRFAWTIAAIGWILAVAGWGAIAAIALDLHAPQPAAFTEPPAPLPRKNPRTTSQLLVAPKLVVPLKTVTP